MNEVKKIVNLTPHTLVLRDAEGIDHVIEPSGKPARVTSTPGTLQEYPGVPVPVAGPTVWGEITNLPEPEEGTIYIVSLVVAQRSPRPDIVSPGTGPQDGAIRDEKGFITAITRLNASM